MDSSVERSHKLATKIIAAVFSTVAPGLATRVGGLHEIADALIDRSAQQRAHETLVQQFANAADQLAGRLVRFESVEFSTLDDGERTAAIDAVCTTLEALQLSKTDVIRKDVDADQLFAELAAPLERALHEALLSEAGIGYGRMFSREACGYLVALVRGMPEFTADVSVENLTLSRKIHELLERGIDSVVLPRYRTGTAHEISEFEARYFSDLVVRYKDMELFGIDLPVPELRRQPIDIAYITLQSSGSDIYTSRISRYEQSTVGSGQIAPVDAALGHLAERARRSQRGLRILLTGQAGCGKTTLTHWLVVSAARRRFPEALARWNGFCPFVVQLRNVFAARWPEFPPEEVLVSVASRRRASLPGDWLSDRLRAGDCFVVLDGLDELPESRQSMALGWIESLCASYPRLNLIVTSRPEGLDANWFERHRFAQLGILPMSLRDIKRCVRHWFDAVASLVPWRRDELTRQRDALLNDVERRGAVRDLAETPLVCAMLCAFYAYDLSGVAPDSRGELYERVLRTLVHKRERERNPADDAVLGFSLKDKLIVLRRIARHMTDQQTASLRTRPRIPAATPERSGQVTALDLITERARSMPRLSLADSDVLDHLLKRSVVWREVAPGEAQFVHRTFQEFLAACDYAENRAVEELISHIGKPQWHGVIAFAAEYLDQESVSTLINALLDRGSALERGSVWQSAVGARETFLLAAECLSAARGVEESVIDRATHLLTQILPPRTIHEAELLGRGNDGIIPLLAGYADEPDETVTACVRAAAVAGGPAGLNLIASYRDRAAAQAVRAEILRDWQYFDAAAYAQRVVSQIALGDTSLVLSTAPMVEAAGYLTNARRMRIDTNDGLTDFLDLTHLTGLEELDCGNCRSLRSMAGIAQLTGLRRLGLTGRTNLADFAEIAEIPALEQLYIGGASAATGGPETIARLSGLRVLYLDGWHLADYSLLAELPRLWTLSIDGCPTSSLDFCAHLPELRTLRARTAHGLQNISALNDCAQLRRLSLSLAPQRTEPLALPGALRSLDLSGTLTGDDIGALTRHTKLTELRVHDPGSGKTRPFAMLHNLRTLAITGAPTLTDGSGLAHLRSLRNLDLSDTGIQSLSFLEGLTELRELNLDGCHQLSDLQWLYDLPRLERLVLPPMEETVIDEIRGAVANPHLSIECEAFPFVGQATG